MNLKRLHGIATVALITIAAALFAGCSNSMAGSVDGDSNARMATLSLSATGIPNDYAEQIERAYSNVGARSIVPNDPYTLGDSLEFYLSGSSERGKELADMKVKLTADGDDKWVLSKDDGKPITLDAMSWTLVLTAYKTYTSQGATTNEPVLQGFCTVDLRNGSASASFVMGTAGLSTNGSVKLGGTIVDKDDAAIAYTMGIYRMDTGVVVAGTGRDGALTVNDGDNEIFTYAKTTVPPGTYWYKMIFYADTQKTTIVGSYMDTIIVEPGNDLEQDDIIVDVIGKKPTQPEDLMAYLISGMESSEGTTYDVKVTWTQSKYATNYELNVVEFDGDVNDIDTTFAANATGLIENGTIYGMSSMAKAADNVKNFLDVNSKVGVKNNSTALMYGTDSCTLTLETGKLYEIQLRARNYIGVSDWANREAATDDSDANTVEYDAPATQRINRLLVTYNLDGGTLKLGASNSYTIEYAEYYTWKKSDTNNHMLLTPLTNSTGAADTATTLIKGSDSTKSDFAEWKLEKGVAVKGNVDDSNGDTIVNLDSTDLVVNKYTYKNATVKAFFGNTVSLSVSAEAQTTYIKFTDVTVTYGATGATTSVPVNEDGNTVNEGDIYVIPKKTNDNKPTSVQVLLGTASGTDPVHKNVEFVATKQDGTRMNLKTESGTTCFLPTESYAPGEKGTVIIKATDAKTGKLVSYTVTLLME